MPRFERLKRLRKRLGDAVRAMDEDVDRIHRGAAWRPPSRIMRLWDLDPTRGPEEEGKAALPQYAVHGPKIIVVMEGQTHMFDNPLESREMSLIERKNFDGVKKRLNPVVHRNVSDDEKLLLHQLNRHLKAGDAAGADDLARMLVKGMTAKERALLQQLRQQMRAGNIEGVQIVLKMLKGRG
jgi:hypothetical protein